MNFKSLSELKFFPSAQLRLPKRTGGCSGLINLKLAEERLKLTGLGIPAYAAAAPEPSTPTPLESTN